MSEALHLVSSHLTPSKGQKHTSPHVVYNNVSPYLDPASMAVCTTPPPDEPSAMEITATQSIIIETNDTVTKNLDRGQFIINITQDHRSAKHSKHSVLPACTIINTVSEHIDILSTFPNV